MLLKQHKYAHHEGDTSESVVFHWSSEHYLLVLAYSCFIGVGQTPEKTFNEIAQISEGISLPLPAQHYGPFLGLFAQEIHSRSAHDGIAKRAILEHCRHRQRRMG